MSLFGNILDKLGLKRSAEKPADKPAASERAAPDLPTEKARAGARAKAASAEESGPAAISEVDVVSQLEERAAANPQELNWKVSIVDLLKLLDLDSSQEARKELATELGCPPDMMDDSAEMNTWLHKTVLKKLAEHGGNIPEELLD